MLLFIDEGLPKRVAPALREVRIDCRCSGEPGCPDRDTAEEDSVVVDWCVMNSALLITMDFGSKSREMILALERTELPVVFVSPQPNGRALLHGLLDQLTDIMVLHQAAQERGHHTIIDLDLSAARPKARRRKGGLPNLKAAHKKKA